MIQTEAPPRTRDYGLNEFRGVIAQISEEVQDERIRQNIKFRKGSLTSGCHSVAEWGNILGEEYLEVQRAANDVIWPPEPKYPSELLAHYREELVQVAALCFAIIERIDDNDPMLLRNTF